MIEDGIKRLNYYNRQYLGFKDFQGEQKYHIDMRRRHNIAHHTWGIVVGLELERKETFKGSKTYVNPGMAVDGFGREIIVSAREPLDTVKIVDQLAGATLPARLKVWIAYDVEKANPPKSGYEICNTEDQFMRVRETFRLIYNDDPSFKGKTPEDSKTWPQASGELPDDPDKDPWPIYLGTIVWDTDPQNPSQKVITGVESVDSRDKLLRHYVGIFGGTLTLGPSRSEILRGDDPGTKDPITGKPNNGLLIQSAQTVEINIDSNDNPSDMFTVTKGSNRTELLRVQEDGKLGIGTTDPEYKLDVPSGWFRFGPGGDKGRIFAEYGSPPDPLAPILKLSGYDNPPRIQFQQTGTGNEKNPEYYAWIGMAKGESNDLTIMSGNMGIGTPAPKNKLDVKGGAVIGSTYSGTNTAPANGLLVQGKVGIGTTDPKYALDVPSGWFRFGPGGDDGRIFAEDGSPPDPLAPILKLSGYDNPPRIQFQQTGTGNETNPQYNAWIGMAKGESNDLAIITKDNKGNVGIGTMTPKNKLDVTGGAVIGATYSGTNKAPGNGLLVEGNVGIGTTDPGEMLAVNGIIESKQGGIKFPDGSIQKTALVENQMKIFGEWAVKECNETYKAETDGFVIAFLSFTSESGYPGIYFYTDSNNPPKTMRTIAIGALTHNLTCPVRKGDYWKIHHSSGGTPQVWWIPLGN